MKYFYFYILILIIYIIILFIINYNSTNYQHFSNFYNKKYIFTYWENIKTKKTPPHINLCFKTMKKHFINYNFIILNNNNIKLYLPNIRNDLNKLHIAQKVDYYRIKLLEKYGGLWIDADTIILKKPDEIFNKLNDYDFVGFGCTGLKCHKSGYPNPSNGVMASRKKGILISCVSNKLDQILDNKNYGYDYFDLGKKVIWSCLSDLMKNNNYNYFHFDVSYDGSRDINGNWINSKNHFSKDKTILMNENNAFFVFLANYEIMNEPEYFWILNSTENDLLYGNYFISYLFKKSLL